MAVLEFKSVFRVFLKILQEIPTGVIQLNQSKKHLH